MTNKHPAIDGDAAAEREIPSDEEVERMCAVLCVHDVLVATCEVMVVEQHGEEEAPTGERLALCLVEEPDLAALDALVVTATHIAASAHQDLDHLAELREAAHEFSRAHRRGYCRNATRRLARALRQARREQCAPGRRSNLEAEWTGLRVWITDPAWGPVLRVRRD